MTYIITFFKHLRTILKHRHMVMWPCFKCGMIWQGLCHDLSKFSPAELFASVRFYQGTSSPIPEQRLFYGYSSIWLHHKGRNKHHMEYWVDLNTSTNRYEPVEVPFKYIAESILDKIAAAKNYNKENFTRIGVLNYYNKEKLHLPLTDLTDSIFTEFLEFYVENGEKALYEKISERIEKEKFGE